MDDGEKKEEAAASGAPIAEEVPNRVSEDRVTCTIKPGLVSEIAIYFAKVWFGTTPFLKMLKEKSEAHCARTSTANCRRVLRSRAV